MLLLLLGSCRDRPNNRFQGYVEGEFVYVASPLAGQLESLQVRRGDQVKAGDPFFALDETAEKAALDQARAALVLSEAEFARQEKLFRMGPAAAQDYDRARSTRDQDRQRVAQAELVELFDESLGLAVLQRKTLKCARSSLKRGLVRFSTAMLFK